MRACSNAINLTGFSVLVVHSCYDRPGVIESSVFFFWPSKSGIRPDSGPRVVEASERANSLLLIVGMIVKEMATE